jgi:hypothetical protein
MSILRAGSGFQTDVSALGRLVPLSEVRPHGKAGRYKLQMLLSEVHGDEPGGMIP